MRCLTPQSVRSRGQTTPPLLWHMQFLKSLLQKKILEIEWKSFTDSEGFGRCWQGVELLLSHKWHSRIRSWEAHKAVIRVGCFLSMGLRSRGNASRDFGLSWQRSKLWNPNTNITRHLSRTFWPFVDRLLTCYVIRPRQPCKLVIKYAEYAFELNFLCSWIKLMYYWSPGIMDYTLGFNAAISSKCAFYRNIFICSKLCQ